MQMDKFKIEQLIGHGPFGKVYDAVNTITGDKVAIKMIDESSLSPNARHHLQKEITALKELKHPSIVRPFSHVSSRGNVCIVMEYLRGGDVATKIRQSGHVNEDVAWKYFRQLIGAVSFFHSKGMTHRDLKPENLFLDSHGNLKVADFGLSATSDNLRGNHTVCGTRSFVAPEVVTCKEAYDGASVDVYSCGAILYHLLAGYMPIAEMSPAEYIRRAQTADFRFPDWFSEDVKDLIRRLLEPDPQKRLTIAQIEMTRWYQKRPEPSRTSTKRLEASSKPTKRPEASGTPIKPPEANRTSTKEASRTPTNRSETPTPIKEVKGSRSTKRPEASRTPTNRSKDPAEYIPQAQKAAFRFPDWFSEDVKDLMGRLLEPHPKKMHAIAQIDRIRWYQKRPEASTTSTKHPEPSRTFIKDASRTPTNSSGDPTTPIKEAFVTPTKQPELCRKRSKSPETSRTSTKQPEFCRRHSKSPGLLKKIASTLVSSITCSASAKPGGRYCCGCGKYHRH